MAQSKQKEVAKKETAGLPAMMADMASDAGMGMEGADNQSFAIPFLVVLQSNSPQLDELDGAKKGQFLNTVTNELYDEVLAVPCAFQRRYLRWAPRSLGGGYAGEYSPIDVETGKVEGLSKHEGQLLMDVPETGVVYDKEGKPQHDVLKDTRNHFVLAKTHAGTWRPALISMASTQIKKSKRWMARIQDIELRDANGKAFNPPSFSHIYRLKTVKEENSKGNWMGVVIELVGMVEDAELYARAKDFHKQVVAGNVEIAEPVAEAGGEDEAF